MQVSVTLNDPFYYSTALRTFLVFLVVLSIIIKLLRKYVFKPKEKARPVVMIDLFSVKRKYTNELDRILYEDMEERQKYNLLSDVLRSFVTEVTGVNVRNKTLAEISKMKNPVITNLIKEFYEPEFSLNSDFSVEESIQKTREVISSWR